METSTITNKISFEKLSESNQLYILKKMKRASDDMPIATARIEREAEYLKENGFVEGEHFKRVLEKRTFEDYVIYYDKNDAKDFYRFEYDVLEASILLRYKRFNSSCGTISMYKTAVDINSNGLIEESGNIMQKRGSFKPSTILSKITYLNELADNEKIAFDKKASRLEYAVTEYSKYYPNAKVTTHLNYDRSNNFSVNTNVVKVTFPSGSYMDIAIVSEDKIIKIHDAELSNLTITQVLNKFNQQEPCGVEATA